LAITDAMPLPMPVDTPVTTTLFMSNSILLTTSTCARRLTMSTQGGS